MIDCPDLIEADVLILIAEADMHVPRTLAQLRRRWDDETKARSVMTLPYSLQSADVSRH